MRIFSYASMTFCSCELDLDQMTKIYDNLKTYPHIIKMKFLDQGFQKLYHDRINELMQ